MRFLVDNPVSPLVAEALNAAGHDAVHAGDRGLHQADDEVLVDIAKNDEGRPVIRTSTRSGRNDLGHRTFDVPTLTPMI